MCRERERSLTFPFLQLCSRSPAAAAVLSLLLSLPCLSAVCAEVRGVAAHHQHGIPLFFCQLISSFPLRDAGLLCFNLPVITIMICDITVLELQFIRIICNIMDGAKEQSLSWLLVHSGANIRNCELKTF